MQKIFFWGLKPNFYILFLGIVSCVSNIAYGQKKILLFASPENTYYSEYIVAIEALKSAGYEVDIRSAGIDSIATYMLPSGTTIDQTAESLAGSSYADFTTQYEQNFNRVWNPSLDATPNYVLSNGSILDIVNMAEYDALVIAGGTGILDYRLDGTYSDQGSGSRLITAFTVKQVAEKLNALAVEALDFSKPILAQCHGASLPVFWRIPITSGPGPEDLGLSLLKGQQVAGYPDAATTADYATLFVTHSPSDPVRISTPNSSFMNSRNATSKIITSRDWYPQTVSYAARTLLNVLDTYPTIPELERVYKILILHGGTINTNNCSPSNRVNDIPCNYGTGDSLPADYTDVVALLSSDSPTDFYTFQVTEVNLTSTSLPFNPANKVQILAYFRKFDGIVFFKHWSTGITSEIQEALVSYADIGGGVVGLHHALYNDIDGARNKNILVNQLFGAESAMSGWSANLTDYEVYSTNYGHFVSSYFHPYTSAGFAPANWVGNILPDGTSNSFAEYHRFGVFDEIYNNMTFAAGQSFGRNINQINPLFSNNLEPSSQAHTTGFVKLFNPALDMSVGRVAYFQIGESIENYKFDHVYAQIVRNAMVWTAKNRVSVVVGMDELEELIGLRCYPNPATELITLEFSEVQEAKNIRLSAISGSTVLEFGTQTGTEINLNTKSLHPGIYVLSFEIESIPMKKRIIIQ